MADAPTSSFTRIGVSRNVFRREYQDIWATAIVVAPILQVFKFFASLAMLRLVQSRTYYDIMDRSLLVASLKLFLGSYPENAPTRAKPWYQPLKGQGGVWQRDFANRIADFKELYRNDPNPFIGDLCAENTDQIQMLVNEQVLTYVADQMVCIQFALTPTLTLLP